MSVGVNKKSSTDLANLTYDGTFTTPTAVSMERVIYPFEGDTVNFLLEQDYVVRQDYYPDNVPSPGTQHPDYPYLYFVKDSPISPLGGAICRYTRTWGCIPGTLGEDSLNAYGRVEGESYVWTKPGVQPTDQLFQIYLVTSIATNGPYIDLISSAGSTNLTLATDPIIQVAYNTLDTATGIWHSRVVTKELIAINGGTATIKPVFDIGPISYQWFGRSQVKREPIQIVVPSLLYFDYWLPGVNCDSVESIPIIQKWAIYDETGNETNYLSNLSSPPLYADGSGTKSYREMVRDGDRIVVEPSIVRRWMGEIYERVTRYIVIQ